MRPLAAVMSEYERAYLVRVLASCEWRRMEAAEVLGISRKNLWEKMAAHRIEDGEKPGADAECDKTDLPRVIRRAARRGARR